MNNEDIKVLENIIYNDQGKKMSYVDVDYAEGEKFINAIENLINRNKELEERNQNSILYIKPINENLEDKIFRLEKDLGQIIEEKDYLKSKVIEYNEKINDYIPKSKVREMKDKLLKEYKCAEEGFMKKQIPTSVVDGTIVQELGWILQEIDKLLQEGDTNETKM